MPTALVGRQKGAYLMQDGEITRARAIEIARLVLRGDALKLYRWSERQ